MCSMWKEIVSILLQVLLMIQKCSTTVAVFFPHMFICRKKKLTDRTTGKGLKKVASSDRIFQPGVLLYWLWIKRVVEFLQGVHYQRGGAGVLQLAAGHYLCCPEWAAMKELLSHVVFPTLSVSACLQFIIISVVLWWNFTFSQAASIPKQSLLK